VRDIIRVKESEYKELGLDNPSLSDQQLLQALSDHPKLIERPVVSHRGKAALGRPPEKVLALIRGNEPTPTP
jgi:arsenate reductase